MITLLFDMAPVGAGIAVVAAVGFFFVFLAIAFIAFKLLKRTVRMAVRVIVVGLIVAVAISGSVLLFNYGTAKPTRPQPRPPASR